MKTNVNVDITEFANKVTKNELREAKKDNKKLQSLIDSLTEKLDNLETENENLKTKNAELGDNLDNLESMIKDQVSTIKYLEKLYTKIESKISMLEDFNGFIATINEQKYDILELLKEIKK